MVCTTGEGRRVTYPDTRFTPHSMGRGSVIWARDPGSLILRRGFTLAPSAMRYPLAEVQEGACLWPFWPMLFGGALLFPILGLCWLAIPPEAPSSWFPSLLPHASGVSQLANADS